MAEVPLPDCLIPIHCSFVCLPSQFSSPFTHHSHLSKQAFVNYGSIFSLGKMLLFIDSDDEDNFWLELGVVCVMS